MKMLSKEQKSEKTKKNWKGSGGGTSRKITKAAECLCNEKGRENVSLLNRVLYK